jgi:hypothetical protein
MAGRLKTLVAQSMRSIRFAARAKGEAPCTLEESLVRIRQAKVVYFGERHHNPDVLKVCAVTECFGTRKCPLAVVCRPLVHLPEGTVWGPFNYTAAKPSGFSRTIRPWYTGTAVRAAGVGGETAGSPPNPTHGGARDVQPRAAAAH